ncbi:MAG: hypothetical protein EOL97_01030 [Spirochaetia bacterium]|nr:hypothetical protein [Spirochaetia bacterium]
MLESRRVLELGNRVHWYMIWLCFGLLTYYNLGLIYDINSDYMFFISKVLSMLILFCLVFGIWILVYSLAIFLQDRIFPTRIFVINLIRIIFIIILDISYSLVVNIAGESIFI